MPDHQHGGQKTLLTLMVPTDPLTTTHGLKLLISDATNDTTKNLLNLGIGVLSFHIKMYMSKLLF